MSKKTVTEAASQLLSAVELETHLAIDVLPTDERALAARFVSERLHGCLTSAVETAQKKQKSGIAAAKAEIRKALVAEMNAISLKLIDQAKDGFEALASSPLQFLINTANTGEVPDIEAFAFEQFPFIRFHGEALHAALRLRAQPDRVQFEALRFAYHRWELEGVEMTDGLPSPPLPEAETDALRKQKAVKALHDLGKQRLSLTVQEDLDVFYSCIELGSVHAYAVPIAIPATLSQDDLRFVAGAFGGLGRTLNVPFELRFAGSGRDLKNARAARLRYESAGVGFQILSAWMTALDVIDEVRHCSICYRHASAISRCSVHATKTQETKVARLGKKVRPSYQQKLLAYSRAAPIKKLFRTGLSWTGEVTDDMEVAASLTGLSFLARRRALVLAGQLRELRVVMNKDIQIAAAQLFGSILAVAVSIEEQPAPVGDWETRIRERERLALKELLSIKGFFKAWCGQGRYSPEVNLCMLGFDRDHPVAKGGALAGTVIPRTLIKQRAWSEAATEFKAANLPTVRDVNRILQRGGSKHAVASELGVGLSTVYKILKRGRTQRKRQYLG
ncbi:hypothetical protein [Variovorax sp. dw_954]|uniref:hypothetical protein n=1 Tax=Variovorax sp. dw_954 TaxID=2720078 RepID=UPI001BD55999|nr:hypothetical protein [Variovorax sp. dw_954]